MSMFSFEVGKKEIHNITFETILVFMFKITIDGRPVYKGSHRFGDKEVVFDVGTKEKHKIRINWHIPIISSMFRTWEVQVFIDGKLYNTYQL